LKTIDASIDHRGAKNAKITNNNSYISHNIFKQTLKELYNTNLDYSNNIWKISENKENLMN
jgi:hypothetical protein